MVLNLWNPTLVSPLAQFPRLTPGNLSAFAQPKTEQKQSSREVIVAGASLLDRDPSRFSLTLGLLLSLGAIDGSPPLHVFLSFTPRKVARKHSSPGGCRTAMKQPSPTLRRSSEASLQPLLPRQDRAEAFPASRSCSPLLCLVTASCFRFLLNFDESIESYECSKYADWFRVIRAILDWFGVVRNWFGVPELSGVIRDHSRSVRNRAGLSGSVRTLLKAVRSLSELLEAIRSCPGWFGTCSRSSEAVRGGSGPIRGHWEFARSDSRLFRGSSRLVQQPCTPTSLFTRAWRVGFVCFLQIAKSYKISLFLM